MSVHLLFVVQYLRLGQRLKVIVDGLDLALGVSSSRV